MLKQLANLTVEADGRYATESELQFLKDYLDSVEQRINTYEKIRDSETKIVEKVEQKKQEINPDLFKLNGRDVSAICKRDLIDILRCSAAAMLLGDLDYLRDGMLIWYQTIVRSYGYQKHDETIYEILTKVVKVSLTPEEFELILPALQLDHALLS